MPAAINCKPNWRKFLSDNRKIALYLAGTPAFVRLCTQKNPQVPAEYRLRLRLFLIVRYRAQVVALLLYAILLAAEFAAELPIDDPLPHVGQE
jgi:hypothetical protein